MANPQLVTAPDADIQLLDVEEVLKPYLRLDTYDEDNTIEGLLAAAVTDAQDYLGRRFLNHIYDYFVQDWPECGYIELTPAPLVSVASITYTDCNGVAAVWPATEYLVDAVSEPGRVVRGYGKSWPGVTLSPSNPIVIRFTCGYGDEAADVPVRFLEWLKKDVAYRYENREPGDKALQEAMKLQRQEDLGPERVWRF